MKRKTKYSAQRSLNWLWSFGGEEGWGWGGGKHQQTSLTVLAGSSKMSAERLHWIIPSGFRKIDIGEMYPHLPNQFLEKKQISLISSPISPYAHFIKIVCISNLLK